MKRMFTILILCVFFATGVAYAQTSADHGSGGQQQQKPMTKEELKKAIDHAHTLVNIYLYRFSRDVGRDRDLQTYLYWLKRRQELVAQYNSMN